MFTIVISEKGGAERRETFDKNEINVGRVQGNDLMLPKGNVSKHHARLLYRDGRFIVTDLKSTNGTYVNGRKIAQATIVREGDKIYIGDFILRIDGGAEAEVPAPPDAAAPPPMPPMPPMQMAPMAPQMAGAGTPLGPPVAPIMTAPAPPPHMPAGMPPIPPAPMNMGGQQAPMPPQPMSPHMMAQMPTPGAPIPVPGRAGYPAAMPPLPGGGPQPPRASDSGNVSHYPLERDPDEAEAQQQQQQAAPPPQQQSQQKVPAPPRVPTLGSQGMRGTLAMGAGPAPSVSRPSSMPPPQPAPPARTSQPGSTPSRVPPRESPQQAGRRLALGSMIDRIVEALGDSAALRAVAVLPDVVERVEKFAAEQAKSMKEEGEIPEGVDPDAVKGDAVRELTGLGAVGPLLEEDEVAEIHCLRHDQILAVRAGSLVLADASYTSDAALGRAIERLAATTDQPVRPDESFVDRRLARGAHMLAFRPPASAAHALVIRKRRKLEMSLEDFVRLSAMSRGMATFLEGCLTARANLLVCGSSPVASSLLLGALVAAGSSGDRVAVLQDEEEFGISQGHVVRLAVGGAMSAESQVRSAARMRPDRLVVGNMGGALVASVLEAIGEGAEGVLAAMCAPSLRQALSRLSGQLLLARPGLATDAARDLLGEAFDVAVELHMLPDGRHRVVRISELGGADPKGIFARDIFVAAGDGAGESHVATGVVPRIVNEFALRGVRVDTNLFKKAR